MPCTSNGGERRGVRRAPPPPHRRTWGADRTLGVPRTEPLRLKPTKEFQRWTGGVHRQAGNLAQPPRGDSARLRL
ncbi:unnamed protein product [Rangifer tarandus platyrhynchus]|uniref:Uncharacterized protein n=1 Tax=Rangifer tarandus platyrhynchus TaxID=3082113 RepID=A0ABN8XY22_RANTA|nr:unnamed protein product [Rangifer tarandus platyrhynchus]